MLSNRYIPSWLPQSQSGPRTTRAFENIPLTSIFFEFARFGTSWLKNVHRSVNNWYDKLKNFDDFFEIFTFFHSFQHLFKKSIIMFDSGNHLQRINEPGWILTRGLEFWRTYDSSRACLTCNNYDISHNLDIASTSSGFPECSDDTSYIRC